MSSMSVGLVIRPQAVEVVTLKNAFQGARLARFARVTFAVDPESPPEAQDQKIVQAIQDALGACEAHNKDVAVSIPSRDVLLRFFTLPLLPKAERDQAVQFEVRKYIPFKIDELTWNYHAIEHRQAKQLGVVFVGIRNDAFARIQQWLSAAGVEPVAVEALSVSLARVAGVVTKASKGSFVGVVDVEEDSAHITIVRDGTPYLSRDVSLGARSELLQGAASQSRADRWAELLLSELRLSFEFFTREHPEASIDKVLLFGEEQTIAPWCAWLSEQLRRPVEVGPMPVKSLSSSPAPSPAFTTATGVALGGLRRSNVKLGFLKRDKREVARARKRLSPPVLLQPNPQVLKSLGRAVAVQIGVAAFCLLALSAVDNYRVNAAKAKLDRAIKSPTDVGWGLLQKTPPQLQAIKQQVDRRLAFLRRAVEQRISVAMKLDVLAKLLPGGIWLDRVSFTDRLEGGGPSQATLTVQGNCFLPGSGKELAVISEFVEQMKGHGGFFQGFESSQLSEIAATQDPASQYSYRTFSLNCRAAGKL
jgi:Tfp pilus assembly PilM family ATPase